MVCTCSLGANKLDKAFIATALGGRSGPRTTSDYEYCTTSLQHTLQQQIHQNSIVGTEQTFPSCVSRCRESGSTNNIFASGRLVIGGARDEMSALLSAYYVVFALRRLGIQSADVYNFYVQNIVSSFGLGYRLNLRTFYLDHQVDTGYKPDKFGGAAWSFCGVNIGLFSAGNAIVTGGKSFATHEQAYAKALVELQKYKAEGEYTSRAAEESKTPAAVHQKTESVVKKRRKKLVHANYRRSEVRSLNRTREEDQRRQQKVIARNKNNNGGLHPDVPGDP
jgi:TATA-box binding protein (TBP) (component of TFIID and TFIIIB)